MFLQHTLPAQRTLAHTGVKLPRTKGNAPVTTIEQVAGDFSTRSFLRKPHADGLALIAQLHHVYARNLAVAEQLLHRRAVVKTREQQACWAQGQVGAQQLFFFSAVVVGHTNQGVKARSKQFAVNGFEQIHKQGVGQQGHQHQHLVAAL